MSLRPPKAHIRPDSLEPHRPDRIGEHPLTYEGARRTHAEFKSPRPSTFDPRAYHHDLAPESNPRSPYPYLVDPEERPVRHTQPYAPTFDGSLDPEVYIDWEEQMDQYFERTNISELGQVRLAKTKFTQHARSHWYVIEHECYHKGEEISTWRDMRSKLRDKYLDRFYEQRLLDRWYRLRQDDRPVSEYIKEF